MKGVINMDESCPVCSILQENNRTMKERIQYLEHIIFVHNQDLRKLGLKEVNYK